MKHDRRLLVGVFFTGFSVMVLELLGTRIVAPYIGSSLYVWTALIGVVLGFLSLGYYLGGELSLRGATFKRLSELVFWSGVWVLLIALTKEVIMTTLTDVITSSYIQAILTAMVLFGIPSLLLGAVSPYAARLLISSVNSAGVSVGRLYAISTLGSIAGTFATGFWLVPVFGHLMILYAVAFLLTLVCLLFSRDQLWLKLLLLGLACWGLLTKITLPGKDRAELVLDTDTAYSRVWIQDYAVGEGIDRYLILNGAYSSGISLDSRTKVAFPYYPYYDLMFWQGPELEQVLMIGGAGMGYPRYVAEKYPDLKMTVVEIDPALYDLAIKVMDYQPTTQITPVFEDGRVFLNHNRQKFDAILLDAFSAYTIPSHLVSVEAVEKIYQALADNGLVIVNMIGTIRGEKARIPEAITATYAHVFPQVEIFGVMNPQDTDLVQNLVLVAAKQPLNFGSNQLSPFSRQLLANRIEIGRSAHILTDDWSPIDRYTVGLITE